MDRRLALRMIFLLVAALLGGLLFVFHVRDMEHRRLTARSPGTGRHAGDHGRSDRD